VKKWNRICLFTTKLYLTSILMIRIMRTFLRFCWKFKRR